MSVDACSLVEPSFLKSSVHTYAEKILFTVVQVLGYIINLRRITALLVSEVETVQPHLRIAEDTVKLYPDVLSVVFGRNSEGLSVPAYACLGVFKSHLLVAVAVTGLLGIRKIHDPVVRKVYNLPSGSIELSDIWSLIVDRGSLGKIVEILRAAAEVLGRR